MATSRLKTKVAVGAAAVAVIGAFEGVRQTAYRDVVGVPTVCFGETQGVKMGDRYTLDECKVMFRNSLEKYALPVERCIKRPMADSTYISFVSLSYNIGSGGFCNSSVARLYNMGRTREACDYMLRYNRAGRKVFPGLERRRQAERKLCLQGADL
jgi:lysozyme